MRPLFFSTALVLPLAAGLEAVPVLFAGAAVFLGYKMVSFNIIAYNEDKRPNNDASLIVIKKLIRILKITIVKDADAQTGTKEKRGMQANERGVPKVGTSTKVVPIRFFLYMQAHEMDI
jgi:hypothetical protein